MTYDDQITLIKLHGYDADGNPYKDENGNHVPQETRSDVLCNAKSVKRSEFYAARTSGLTPEQVFVLHRFEYEGQELVEFMGRRYTVIRTYSDNPEEIELIVKGELKDGKA